jgi:hypothetical protein
VIAMGESVQHMKLVRSLVGWVAQAYFDGDLGHIFVDSPEGLLSGRPPPLGGFVPDVYAQRLGPKTVIVGEAKTPRDLESRHTQAQLTAFLGHCTQVPGSVFVLAVPWPMTRFARSLLGAIQRHHRLPAVSTIVLDQLEG